MSALSNTILTDQYLLTNPRKARAQRIVEANMRWAVLIGLVPYAFTAGMIIKIIQLKMIHQLSVEYQVKFTENLGKTIVLVLIAGLTATTIVNALQFLIPRYNPLGFISNTVTLAIGSGALTYAVGHIMINHFESGGTLENLNVEKSRQHLSKMINEGKEVARHLVDQKTKNKKQTMIGVSL